jgi:hypothetical protein
MSDAPKFKTFRDLRSVPSVAVKELSSSTSIAGSIPGNTAELSIAGTDKKTQTEISPARDFQKVPNSVSKNLDLFRGKSKQVWDYLWSVSRGAIVPTRIIRKSRNEIKKGAALGSMVTVDAAIRHLEQIGLIKKASYNGSFVGNEYEVFTPEEIELSYTTYTSTPSSTSPTQKVGILGVLESSIASIAQIVENKATYSHPKTSLKTIENIDDEPFGKMLKILSNVSEKVAGKKPHKSEIENWKHVGELIAMELEIAAARTKSISNVPAFLTEHLRRRLLGSSVKPATEKLKATRSTKVGKLERIVERYEAEPLSKEGREAVLKTMQEYIGRGHQEFIMSQQDTYTRDDWNWLMKRMEKQ